MGLAREVTCRSGSGGGGFFSTGLWKLKGFALASISSFRRVRGRGRGRGRGRVRARARARVRGRGRVKVRVRVRVGV